MSLGILALLVWPARLYYPRAAFGGMWVVVSLLPRFFVRTAGSILNEHQFRTASIGIMLLLVLWVESLWPSESVR
jgi:hypothetical protein